MTPYMVENGVAIVKKTDFTQISIGDVVTYELDKQFITHRVIAVSGGRVTVKGDANAFADTQAVTAENFVGTIAGRMNWLAPVVTDFKTDLTRALVRYVGIPLVGIALIWFIIAMLRKFAQAGKRESLECSEQHKAQEASSCS